MRSITALISGDVGIVLLQRLWQAGAGLVTMSLAVRFLDPQQQGWYYSFLSLAALYTLFDLGLSLVLVQVSAHLFTGARWGAGGRVHGDNMQKIFSLVGGGARWYCLLAILFALLAVPGGLLFFGPRANVEEATWLAPWTILVIATAVGLLPLPFLSVIEGSGKIGEVYKLRLLQGITGSLACWFTLALGGGLWAATMVPIMAAIVSFTWLAFRKGTLVAAAWTNSGHLREWKSDVWPLQWRLAVGWVCAYVMTQIYTPVLFRLDGPVAAGQMGLSLSISNMLGLLAQSWIVQRVPQMAQAAARRDWTTLDGVFRRDLIASTGVLIAAALVLCLLRAMLHSTRFDNRLLPFWQFSGLLGITLLNHWIGALAAQLRSFRKEPLIPITVASTVITLPLAIWAATAYSSAGIVSSLLLVNLFFTFPAAVYIWIRCSRQWRNNI